MTTKTPLPTRHVDKPVTSAAGKPKRTDHPAKRSHSPYARPSPGEHHLWLVSYIKLVRRFPLVPIRDEEHLDRAQTVIDDLLAQELDDGGEQYLDTLSALVSAYEDVHHPIPAVPPGELLAYLLSSNGQSQADLVRATGIAKATVSDVLSGKRFLTVEQMHAVGKHFGLPAAAFLPAV